MILFLTILISLVLTAIIMVAVGIFCHRYDEHIEYFFTGYETWLERNIPQKKRKK